MLANSQPTLSLPLGPKKEVLVDWEGGELSTDAGWLLLSLIDREWRFTERMAACIVDLRDPDRVDHQITELLPQRIYQLAAGYEDGNDAQTLRHDPLLKVAVGRTPTMPALGSQSTLSRLENAVTAEDQEQVEWLLQDVFVAQCGPAPRRIVIDLDPYDDPAHGQQQGVLFNGYYDEHCYLPLLICGTVDDGPQRLIGVVLRKGTAAATDEATGFLTDLVTAIRDHFADVELIVRGDSHYGVPVMIDLCRKLKVHFCFGKGRNPVLLRKAASTAARLQRAETLRQEAGQRTRPCRAYGAFEYQAEGWQQAERTIVKWEETYGTPNPRFVVTDLSAAEGWTAASVYRFYCARGDRENRIKEFKLDMSGARLSCSTFLANQFRLQLCAAAFILYQAVQETIQRVAPQHPLAKAQVPTLRTNFMKLAARVRERGRVVRLHLCTSFPHRQLWEQVVQHWVPALAGPG